MTKKTFLKVAGSLAVMSLATAAIAADHLDSPAVKLDAPADINDLYSFMDGDKVVLIATVFPAAAADSKFSDKIQYIFHTTSGDAFGPEKSTLDIVCTFDAAQMITCKAGAGPDMPVMDMVTGNANVDAGLASTKGMMTVFSGLRKDPFFFNLAGFNKTVETVVGAAAGLMFDAANCPALDMGTSTLLVNQLKSNAMGMPAEDFFATLNGLAIVIKVDKALVTAGGPIVSSWVSTNK